MNTSLTPLARGIAAALIGLGAAALPAHAGLVTTTGSVSFDVTTSVSDAEGGGATSASNVTVGTGSVSKFNASTGVLTGATLNLNSTRTQSTQVTSTAGGGTGANSEVTSSGTGSSSAQLAAAGVSSGFGTLTKDASCTDKRKFACAGSPATNSAATNGALGVASGSLNSYVGSGSASVGLGAPSISAQQLSNAFTGTETTTSTLRWTGSMSMTYDYLLHAAASFSADSALTELTIDFGDVAFGSTQTRGFGLFNLFDPNRVGLDLDGFGTANASAFSTNLALFTGLAAGSSGNLFDVMLDTGTAGLFEASWWLDLSDADVGAADSRHGYHLVLNLRGNVLGPANIGGDDPPVGPPTGPTTGPTTDPRSDVPEPGTLALAAIGFVGAVAARRRRRG